MNKKFVVVIQVVIVILAVAGSIYVAVTPANSLLNWYNVDDAFFYYKVAQNFLTGHGFTFDQINLTNGFHPLWMVVCLGVFWLTRYDLLLPLRVLVLVSGLFNAATALILFRFLRRHIHIGAATVTALFWGLYPAIYGVSTVLGMESSISVFFIVLLVSKASEYFVSAGDKTISTGKLIWLGVLGGLTILARLDNLFIVGAIGVFLLLKIKKIQSTAIFDLLVIAASVFAAWIIRLGSEGVLQNTYSIYPMLVVSLLVKPACLYFLGNYQFNHPIERWKSALRLGLTWLIASLIEFGCLIVLYQLNYIKMFSYSILAIEIVTGFVLALIVHLISFKSIPNSGQKPFVILWRWIQDHWKSVLLQGVIYALPIAMLVGSYMIYNKIVFDSFTPVSGQIKHWWSTMPNTVYGRQTDLITVLGLGINGGNGPWSLLTSKLYNIAQSLSVWLSNTDPDIPYVILVLLTIVVFLWLMRAEKNKYAKKFFMMLIPALFVGCLIHIAYYFSSGYTHTRGWYWMGEMVTLVLAGSLVLDAFFSLIDRIKFHAYINTILVLVAVLLLGRYQYRYLTLLCPNHVAKENQAAYLNETREVEFYTKPGSKIGMTGGGLVAYFIQDRTIVNLDGLINSKAYFDAMKSGVATQFLDKIPLNYVYGKPYTLLQSDPYDEIFKNRLYEIGFIRGYESFTLFKYVVNP